MGEREGQQKSLAVAKTRGGGCGTQNTGCSASLILFISRFLDNLKTIKGVWGGILDYFHLDYDFKRFQTRLLGSA
jgi:hypothetical protein